MLDNKTAFHICYHHAQAGGDFSKATADYHNNIDSKIEAQFKALELLQKQKPSIELVKAFTDEIILLATSADNRVSLEAIGISNTTHNEAIYTRLNRYLPVDEKI